MSLSLENQDNGCYARTYIPRGTYAVENLAQSSQHLASFLFLLSFLFFFKRVAVKGVNDIRSHFSSMYEALHIGIMDQARQLIHLGTRVLYSESHMCENLC